jgi:hypothetical protein
MLRAEVVDCCVRALGSQTRTCGPDQYEENQSKLCIVILPLIQERSHGSGDREEIRKTEHALLDLPRHPA